MGQNAQMYSFWKDRWFFFSEQKCKFENFDQLVDDKKKYSERKTTYFQPALCCLASPQTSFGVRLSRIHEGEMNAGQTNPKGRLRGGYVLSPFVRNDLG